MKYTFIFDINFIWKSFRSTTNISKWMTQFVWISSAISNFSYSKPNQGAQTPKIDVFGKKKFWDIFSVTDIYHISKNKDFLRPSLSKLPDSYRKCLLRTNNIVFDFSDDLIVFHRKPVFLKIERKISVTFLFLKR